VPNYRLTMLFPLGVPNAGAMSRNVGDSPM